MSDNSTRTPHEDGAHEAGSTGAHGRAWTVLAPVIALVVGLVLGGLVVGAGQSGRTPQATATVTVSPSSDPGTTDTTVVIPQECVAGADTLEEATSVLREGVAAVRDFRGQELVDLLNRLEDLEALAREQADACSEVDVTTSSPVPADEESGASAPESATGSATESATGSATLPTTAPDSSGTSR